MQRLMRMAALALGLAYILFMGGAAWAGSVVPRSDLDRNVVRAGEPGAVYVLVRFSVVPEPPGASADRPRLSLALVMDRSGSMSERNKLDYAKGAACGLIDRLGSGDALAVVQYDDRVDVVWPSSLVESKALLKRVVNGISPRGMTNLSGGLMAGVEQLARSAHRVGAVSRVLLLSDGLANRGVTDPRRLAAMAAEARRSGVAVTALGLGLNYDEDLMQALAEHGGGNYYFIENPDQMADIFRRELHLAEAVVGRRARLALESGADVESVQVLGWESRTLEGLTVVDMKDFYAGEERSVLLRLTHSALASGDRARLGRLTFSYRDLADGRDKTMVLDLGLAASSVDSEISAGLNREAASEAALITADFEHQRSLALYGQGRRAEARELMRGLADRLASENRTLNDVKIAKKLDAFELESRDQDRAESDAAFRNRYVKKNKQAMYRSAKGKRNMYLMQRGSRGPEVLALQNALAGRGLYTGPRDGIYTEQVALAVKALQRLEGLGQDGVAGPRTLRSLGLY